MKLFIDSADPREIAGLAGRVAGVTANPVTSQ
jgi:transaldolase